MNVIIIYRVGPEADAALTPARIGTLRVSRDAVEHRLGGELVHTETAASIVEDHHDRVYVSFQGAETVDVSVRPAHEWRSDLFGDARAAARFAGMIGGVPVAVDWVRSSYFDRLAATVDCALLVPDVPVTMDLAA